MLRYVEIKKSSKKKRIYRIYFLPSCNRSYSTLTGKKCKGSIDKTAQFKPPLGPTRAFVWLHHPTWISSWHPLPDVPIKTLPEISFLGYAIHAVPASPMSGKSSNLPSKIWCARLTACIRHFWQSQKDTKSTKNLRNHLCHWGLRFPCSLASGCFGFVLSVLQDLFQSHYILTWGAFKLHTAAEWLIGSYGPAAQFSKILRSQPFLVPLLDTIWPDPAVCNGTFLNFSQAKSPSSLESPGATQKINGSEHEFLKSLFDLTSLSVSRPSWTTSQHITSLASFSLFLASLVHPQTFFTPKMGPENYHLRRWHVSGSIPGQGPPPGNLNRHHRESQRYNLPFTWMLPGFGGSFGPKYTKKRLPEASKTDFSLRRWVKTWRWVKPRNATKGHKIDKISRLLSDSTMANLGGGHPLTWVTNCRVRIKLTPRQCQA